jgi:hypothetical protein
MQFYPVNYLNQFTKDGVTKVNPVSYPDQVLVRKGIDYMVRVFSPLDGKELTNQEEVSDMIVRMKKNASEKKYDGTDHLIISVKYSDVSVIFVSLDTSSASSKNGCGLHPSSHNNRNESLRNCIETVYNSIEGDKIMLFSEACRKVTHEAQEPYSADDFLNSLDLDSTTATSYPNDPSDPKSMGLAWMTNVLVSMTHHTLVEHPISRGGCLLKIELEESGKKIGFGRIPFKLSAPEYVDQWMTGAFEECSDCDIIMGDMNAIENFMTRFLENVSKQDKFEQHQWPSYLPGTFFGAWYDCIPYKDTFTEVE